MNILHINKFHYFRGGSETVYFKTADILASHGHKSIFFSMHHPENLSCNTSNYFMPYVDLNTNGNSGMMGQLKTAGRVIYSFDAKRRLSKLMDEHPADIAHLHNIHHQISPSILHELKKRKIPVVMTLHDYKMVCASYSMLVDGRPCEACYRGRYFEAIKKKCVKGSLSKSVIAALEMFLHHKVLDIYNNVDIFISPSIFLKNKLTEMGFHNRIVHLPNFIDANKFENINGREERLDNSVVYFGRLSQEKGISTLINAARKIGPEVLFKIIGDGYLRSSIEYTVKENGINNVQFLGYMKGEALYQEIKGSKAVILPSECYENNPMSVIEAFALGRPVIGARIGGIPELVRDKETGLTFEPGNADDLSEKIERLLADSSLSVAMGKNARRFVEAELNPERYYQRLMEIYRQVIQ
ncbi:MAG: glycosyltransferase family 4 protein [Nitrospirae bacterium]|nr:glycosyltransferase family 4 protein [Nitrospirota bacterium]